MATGDLTDFVRRARQLLPGGWFPSAPADGEAEQAPVLVGILSGFSSVWSWLWGLFSYVNDQTRLQTSTGFMLDIAADDLFGDGDFPRLSGESDAAYLARIQADLVAQKNTRSAIIAAIESVTGLAPVVVEPTNADDCKGLNSGYGYGSGIRYGHLSGSQFFITTALGNASSAQEIYDAINRTKAAGVIAWVQIAG